MTSISAKLNRVVFGFIILMMSVRSIQAADNMTFDMNKSAAPAPAAPAPAPAAAAPAADSKVLQSIAIDAAGVLNFQGANLQAPSVSKSKGKLVLKFKDTKLASTKTIPGSGLVKDIRSAVHGTDAWVVIDEDNVSTYSFDTTSTGLKMSLTAASASAAPAASKKTDAPASTADSAAADTAAPAPADSDKKSYSRLIDASLRPVDGSLKIVLTADSPAKYTVRKLSTPEKLVVRFINTHLDVPENEQKIQGDATLMGKSGLLSMEIRQIGQNFSPISEAIVTIVPGTTYQIDRNLNQIVISLTAPPVVEKPVERSGNINTLISAEVAGADLSAVVRTLADEAGFDVDMSSAPVSGLVNEKFKNVPLKNALAVLLAPGNYVYEVQGNILRIGTQTTLSASKKILPQITDIIQPAGGMTPAQLQQLVLPILASSNAVSTEVDPVRNVLIIHGTASDVEEYKQALRDLKLEPGEETNRITRVVKLNYADPVTLMGILKTYLTPIGQVQVDPRTEDLIIWEVPENMGVLLELVKEIDIKQPQVLIEADMVDVQDEKDLNIGVNWAVNKTTGDAVTSTAQMLPQNLTTSIVSAPSFSFGTIKDNASISATLEALETKKKGKIISRPRVATVSGVAAELDTIDNVIVSTTTTTLVPNAGSQTTTTFTQVPVPIILKVTPRITDDGRITTQIVADVTSITGAAPPSGPPPTSVQTAQTTLTTKNGETIVIGGLVHETISEEDNGVPLLQDLPILGALFQSKSHVHQKEELVIFVTPTLIED